MLWSITSTKTVYGGSEVFVYLLSNWELIVKRPSSCDLELKIVAESISEFNERIGEGERLEPIASLLKEERSRSACGDRSFEPPELFILDSWSGLERLLIDSESEGGELCDELGIGPGFLFFFLSLDILTEKEKSIRKDEGWE